MILSKMYVRFVERILDENFLVLIVLNFETVVKFLPRGFNVVLKIENRRMLGRELYLCRN